MADTAEASAVAPVEPEGTLLAAGESARKIAGDSPKSDYWIHSMKAEIFFGAWIVLNAIVLAVETDYQDDNNENDWYWVLLDSIFNIVFGVEVILRMVAEKGRWPCLAWNLIDFALVIIGIVDSWILRLVDTGGNVGFLVVLRVFRLLRLARVLRVLRLLRSNKELLLLIAGIGAGLRAMVWGALLLVVVNFISGLLMTEIAGKDMVDGWFLNRDENDAGAIESESIGFYEANFSKLYLSMFTLFEFTMEFQGDHCKSTWADGPWLTFFFIVYTFVTNLALLQVVGSVIVEAILTIADQNHQEDKAEEKEKELKEAKETSDQLFDTLKQSASPTACDLNYKELDFSNEKVSKYLKMAGLVPAQAAQLLKILDKNNTGLLSKAEFSMGLTRLKQDVNPKDIFKLETRLERVKQKIVAACAQQKDLVDMAARM
jgi:voltage-gated sodium channel